MRLSIPLLLTLAVAFAGGCAGPRAAAPAGNVSAADVALDPYRAFPAAPEPALAVRPVSARVTHRGALPLDLAAFLDRLTSAVEGHNWGAVALFADEAGLREQVRFLIEGGIEPHRAASEALAGALGLGLAGQGIGGVGGVTFAELDRIGTMTVDVVEPGIDGAEVQGYVRLDDRSTPRFAFTVSRTPAGPRLVVPAG